MLEDKLFCVPLFSKIQLTVHLCSVLCREFRPTPWLKFLLESLVATLYNWSGFTLHLHIIYVCFPAYHILHGIERKLYRFKVFFLKTNVRNTRKPCWQKHGQDFSAGIFRFICLEGYSLRTLAGGQEWVLLQMYSHARNDSWSGERKTHLKMIRIYFKSCCCFCKVFHTKPERAHDEKELEHNKKVCWRVRCGHLR